MEVMFEVGRDYRVIMISGGEEISGVWKIAATEGTLIKLVNPHTQDLVVNTASSNFVSAEPLKRR